MKQLLDIFGDVKPFLELNTYVSLATRGKLLTMLNDQQQKPYLMVELAVTIDAGMPFVKATYNLEGDGPLPLSFYETSSALNVAARQASYPNFQPVAIQMSEGMHSWNSNSFNIQSHVFSRVLSITFSS